MRVVSTPPGTAPGVAAVLALVALTAAAFVSAPTVTLLGIAWVAFLAMVGGAVLGTRARDDHPRGLVWGYGLASGAMVVSAGGFLLPNAIGPAPQAGGFGVGAGLLAGFAGHTVGHRLTHLDLPFDRAVTELTAHAFAAGVVIGAVYSAGPELGPLLGLAIVSHKGPAGYAAARRLSRRGGPVPALLVPASGVGIAALAVALVGLDPSPTVRGVLFGFSAGVFLHVAMDFLPDCETGGEIQEVASLSAADHHVLDRLRSHAAVSVAVGGGAVVAASLLV